MTWYLESTDVEPRTYGKYTFTLDTGDDSPADVFTIGMANDGLYRWSQRVSVRDSAGVDTADIEIRAVFETEAGVVFQRSLTFVVNEKTGSLLTITVDFAITDTNVTARVIGSPSKSTVSWSGTGEVFFEGFIEQGEA